MVLIMAVFALFCAFIRHEVSTLLDGAAAVARMAAKSAIPLPNRKDKTACLDLSKPVGSAW